MDGSEQQADAQSAPTASPSSSSPPPPPSAAAPPTGRTPSPLSLSVLPVVPNDDNPPQPRDALLAIIADLQSQLQQQQQQSHATMSQPLDGRAQSQQVPARPGSATQSRSRSRRSSTPCNINGATGSSNGSSGGVGIGLGNLNGTVRRPSYAGAPPSSLATPTHVQYSTPPPHALKRDKSYDDLNGVMATASPTSLARNGQARTAHRKPSFTGSALNGSGGASSRIPMPVIAKGSVGTAATLAGGSSPKSPLPYGGAGDGDEEGDGAGRFEGPRPALNVLQDSPHIPSRYGSYQPVGADAEGEDAEPLEDEELLMQSRSGSLPIPPAASLIPRSTSPSLRSPKYSTDSELSPGLDSPDQDSQRVLTNSSRRAGKSSATSATGGAARAGSSPFFGGSAGFTERHAARIASSQSGTSKVIMTLQTELTNSRAQLDSTKSQLRASARAVESLTRQLEDLKESRERQRMELSTVQTTLTRRERMLEDTLARARAAEASLKVSEDDKKVHNAECSRRTRDLEGRCREAEERKARAEAEYQALRGATAALSDGWKKEVKMLRKDQAALRLTGEKDCNDARSRQTAVTKALSARMAAKEDVESALADLAIWKDAFKKQYELTLASISRQSERTDTETANLAAKTAEVLEELAKYKHAMRTFDDRSSGAA